MWLYSAMPVISSLACRVYYRLTVGGARVNPEGPALVVANHTNSLMDPPLVVVAAQRNVRFMAKSTLFTHPGISWLVKAVGSVPVYRQQDDRKAVSQNFDSFRDVSAALAEGHAVGIFPEGISHSASRLQPLKTGAARIALGAAERIGKAFPIVPVGICVSRSQDFSKCRARHRGRCVRLGRHRRRGPNDKEAVRELTRRIEASMRSVTLNLHDWSDEQLVRCAERIWRAEFDVSEDARDEMARLHAATNALAQLRLGEEFAMAPRRARTAGARPHAGPSRTHAAHAQGKRDVGYRASMDAPEDSTDRVRAARRARLRAFWIPREITTAVAEKLARPEGEDAVPTYRVLAGFLFFGIWFLAALRSRRRFFIGPWGALALFVALPFVAMSALVAGESRRLTWDAVKRFFVLRVQRDRVAGRAERQRRQHALGEKLRAL